MEQMCKGIFIRIALNWIASTWCYEINLPTAYAPFTTSTSLHVFSILRLKKRKLNVSRDDFKIKEKETNWTYVQKGVRYSSAVRDGCGRGSVFYDQCHPGDRVKPTGDAHQWEGVVFKCRVVDRSLEIETCLIASCLFSSLQNSIAIS